MSVTKRQLPNGVTAYIPDAGETDPYAAAKKWASDTGGTYKIAPDGSALAYDGDGGFLGQIAKYAPYVIIGAMAATGAANVLGAVAGAGSVAGDVAGVESSIYGGANAASAAATAAGAAGAVKKAVDTASIAKDVIGAVGRVGGAVAQRGADNRTAQTLLDSVNKANQITAEGNYQSAAEARAAALRQTEKDAYANAAHSDYLANRTQGVGVIPATSPEARAAAAQFAQGQRDLMANPGRDLPSVDRLQTDVTIPKPGAAEKIGNAAGVVAPIVGAIGDDKWREWWDSIFHT